MLRCAQCLEFERHLRVVDGVGDLVGVARLGAWQAGMQVDDDGLRPVQLRVVDADDGAADLHGHVHDLDDLLAEDLAQRAAEDGEVSAATAESLFDAVTDRPDRATDADVDALVDACKGADFPLSITGSGRPV